MAALWNGGVHALSGAGGAADPRCTFPEHPLNSSVNRCVKAFGWRTAQKAKSHPSSAPRTLFALKPRVARRWCGIGGTYSTPPFQVRLRQQHVEPRSFTLTRILSPDRTSPSGHRSRILERREDNVPNACRSCARRRSEHVVLHARPRQLGGSRADIPLRAPGANRPALQHQRIVG